VHDTFDWQGDRPPATPLADSVLYEVHVRGFSQRQQALPESLRGSYAALASDWAIAHFKHLGVTALSLMPVHQHLDEHAWWSWG
jgi:pullulanase/glycogen debranching enzyme